MTLFDHQSVLYPMKLMVLNLLTSLVAEDIKREDMGRCTEEYGPVHPLTQQMFLILGLVWRDELEFTKRETGTPGGRNGTCQGYRKGLMCPEGP